MKKIFALTLGLTVLMSLFSCSKEDFDSKYYNPSKTTTVTCDKLLSGVLYVGCEQYKSFGYNTYWRLYTWEGFFAQLTQQRGFNNNSGGTFLNCLCRLLLLRELQAPHPGRQLQLPDRR